MNRQALTEALEHLPAISGVATDRHSIPADRLLILATAARLVERLLPGECENCGGTGIAGVHRHIKQSTGEHLGDQDVPCGFCDNGQVWDEGIVEAAAKVIYDGDRAALKPNDSVVAWDLVILERHRSPWHNQARAVLSALVELLTEKVEK